MFSEHSIGVVMVRAEGLRAADSNGKSDPYIVYGTVADAGKNVRKSKVIEKTLDPVWNEQSRWVFTFREPEWTIFFEIWDKDVIGKDFLGYAEINLKNLVKEKKEYHDIVLNLTGSPKSKEKEAKKVTGKLHIRVNFDLRTLLDESDRQKLDNGCKNVYARTIDELIIFFRETSGGADTITTKQQMAKLAAHRKIFDFVVSHTIQNETNIFNDEMIHELVAEENLLDYFTHIMLALTNSTLENGISLTDFVIGTDVTYTSSFPDPMAKERLDSVHFRMMDFDKDGVLSYNDLLAYQAINEYTIQAKLKNEFMKDPKIATLKGKMGNFSFNMLIRDMYKKYKYDEEQRSLILHMVIKINGGGYETKISKEEFFAWYYDNEKKKNWNSLFKLRMGVIMKDHNKEAQIMLNGAFHKHGVN